MHDAHRHGRRVTALAVPTLAALAAPLFLAPAARAQGLTGQSVHTDVSATGYGSYGQGSTQTVTAAGTTFTFPGVTPVGSLTAVVRPAQLEIDARGAVTFLSGYTFNGLGVTEVGGSPVTITGVSLGSNTLAGFSSSRLTFDGTDIFANFAGLTFTAGQKALVDLSFAPAAVTAPEPSSVAAFAATGLGTLALVLTARKRRRAA